jgi:hypothetical protein
MSIRSQKKSKATTWTVEELGPADVKKAAAWIKAIPFEEWPQQSRIDDQPRPSMVTNPEWHGFGDIATTIIGSLGFDESNAYQPMLSVVMPGHHIEVHQDAQADYWKYRVHVPLLTNAKAVTEMEDGLHHMQVGKAYKVNTAEKHAVWNKGATPRVHFMFDVR